ncbi:MAG: hypothetical protein M1537_01670 [Nitrospirae bacterium]|nr:hypothetical protein [Nitrospirota bacterium]MCL5284177.1 hypothetical protein [Nitrospirota bacterium]
MTGNGDAIRQARYAEKMRSQGKKKLTLWVTPEQEREIRSLFSKQEEKQ